MNKSKKLLLILFALVFAVTAIALAACKPDKPVDPVPPHTHTFQEGWTFDNVNHWHAATCDHASEKSDIAPHILDENGACTVCDYAEVQAQFEFELLEDNTYALTGVTNPDVATFANVPATHEGANVTVIGQEAFCYDGCENLVHVNLPSTITKLEQQAFWGTVGLKQLILPDSLQEIGTYALGASGFEEIVIPENVIVFGQGAFQQSEVLRKVTFRCHEVTLSTYIFYACPALEEIVFDEGVVGVTSMTYPFYEDEAIDKVYVSSTVTKLFYEEVYGKTYENQFDHSEFKFARYEVAQGNSKYSSDSNGILYNADKTVLLHAPLKLTGEITLPQSVQTIWKGAFCNVVGVTKVILPEELSEICSAAFNSSGITELVIPDTVTKLGREPDMPTDSMYHGIVKNCSDLTKLHFGAGVTAKYIDVKNELLTLPSLKEITVSESSSSLRSHNNELLNKEGTYLYFGNDDGEIPDGVESIEYNAFFGNENLTSVTLPSSVTIIDSYAFAKCTNLQSVTLSENLLFIWENAFEGTAIEQITIPASAKNIGANAFKDCASLRSVTFDRADRWEVNDEILDLSDPARNAQYLTETYVDEGWSYNIFA